MSPLDQNNRPFTFKPVGAFRNKLFFYIVSVFIGTTAIIGFFAGLLIVIINVDRDSNNITDTLQQLIQDFGYVILFGYLLLNLLWIIPSVVLAIYYVRAIEYTIGETEIVVRKGVINKTVKYIPFRTITNVSSRYGLYDRFLGIGTVEIETAGKSGQQIEPEAKIEGIKNFQEVRDIILLSLRGLKGTYTTTTETAFIIDSPQQDLEFYKELYRILNEIKEILSK